MGSGHAVSPVVQWHILAAKGVGVVFPNSKRSAVSGCREHNGGLLDLVTLHRLVERRRGSAADPVSLDDIMQAIKKLEVCAWK